MVEARFGLGWSQSAVLTGASCKGVSSLLHAALSQQAGRQTRAALKPVIERVAQARVARTSASSRGVVVHIEAPVHVPEPNSACSSLPTSSLIIRII